MKFRKKPVVVDAVRVLDALYAARSRWSDLPQWLRDAYECGDVIFADDIHIRTLEGTMLAHVNDWIIRGVAGELYPCKPDIFEATYDAVETP